MSSALPQHEEQTRPRGLARRGLFVRFQRSRSGATAVEFAFVLPVFLALIFAIVETALMFWTSQILEESLSQSARSLVTGRSRGLFTGSAAANATAFRNDICARAPTGLIDCSKLTIDVRTYANFANAQAGTSGSNPIAGGALNTNGFSYTQPQPDQIVVARAVLEYRLLITQWSTALANIGGGRRGIVASATFRSEPFE